MNRTLGIVTFAVALLGAGLTATAADAASRRVVSPNAEGGTTATAVSAHQGASGSAARGRAVVTDGQGNATAVSGAAFKGANGAIGARAGQTTVAADGSAQHTSQMSAQSARGSVQSSGGATRAAGGGLTQSRTSTATSAATGNSVQTTTSTGSTGVTHSATCYNASGAAIACPSR